MKRPEPWEREACNLYQSALSLALAAEAHATERNGVASTMAAGSWILAQLSEGHGGPAYQATLRAIARALINGTDKPCSDSH